MSKIWKPGSEEIALFNSGHDKHLSTVATKSRYQRDSQAFTTEKHSPIGETRLWESYEDSSALLTVHSPPTNEA